MLRSAVPRWLPGNPAAEPTRRGTGLPRTTVHEPVFLTGAEVALIAARCDRWCVDMVHVAVRTGLRLGELLVLQVQDVQVTGERRLIRVRRALKRDGTIGQPKSRRSRRDVSISTDVADLLADRLGGKARQDLLFAAPGGGMWHPSNLRQRHWLPAVAAARRCDVHPPPEPPKPARGPRRKLRPDEVSTCDCPTRLHRVPRWHDLRHTHVSLCAEAGWDMVRVSRRVGHEKIATTIDIYGHLWDVESDERLDAVEKLLLTASDEA
jgi:integrase